ncbi:MAG: hypothetical protein RLN82_07960 [Pseudomonadales bacterium]
MRFIDRRLVTSIALLAMLLRILVPTGYMPGSLASGWFLVLCPDGISSSTMAVLMGESGHHHHHMSHGDVDSSADDEYEQCDLGSGFASATIYQSDELALGLFLVLLAIWQATAINLQRLFSQYLARGPPNKLQYQ